MTINEGNEFIAKLIGWELSMSGKKFNNRLPPYGYVKAHPAYLKFHCSWDWLILAVEKIELQKHPVYISSNNCTIYQSAGKDRGWMIDEYGENKIQAVWLAVVEYCKL